MRYWKYVKDLKNIPNEVRRCDKVNRVDLTNENVSYSKYKNSFNDAKNKIEVYEIERELCSRFEKEMGSLICADLLSGADLKVSVGGTPEERTEEYYKKRPCPDIIADAADILEEYLREQGKLK